MDLAQGLQPGGQSGRDRHLAAYLEEPRPGPRTIAEGVTLDVAAAVANDPIAFLTMGWEDATDAARQDAFRTAILLARADV
ncbi:hypothetical protein Mnod_4047 [Methylobacterium nodulans ORS 2060]|uniref:Uncharacterized protein n=1 Tax=Methylobacterium nodulans (strain LMG 21967 / CNCM I-2342 / ORS 2060) TaxID=460265 RepID=B8ITL0_METNO|nr:hypothetical protein Mnod_4047 [Methylobacterium nodulans ORS 2060]